MVARPPLPLPCGMAIAHQFSSVSYLRASLGDGTIKFKGRKGKVPIDSAPGANPCQVGVKLFASGSAKGRSAKKKHQKKVIGKAKATIPGGQSKTMKLKLSKRGAAAVKRGKGISVQVTTIDSTGNTVQTAKVKLKKKGKQKKRTASVQAAVSR